MSAATAEDVLERDASWTDSDYHEKLREAHGWSAERAESAVMADGGEEPTDPEMWDERAEWWARGERHELAGVCSGVANRLRAGEGVEVPESKAAELEENAGAPVGAMPNAEPQKDTIPVDQLLLPGMQDLAKVAKKTAGKQPQTSKLNVKLPAVSVDGAYLKGERITLEVDVLITGEGSVDELDKVTKTATGCERTQTGVTLDVRLKPADSGV